MRDSRKEWKYMERIKKMRNVLIYVMVGWQDCVFLNMIEENSRRSADFDCKRCKCNISRTIIYIFGVSSIEVAVLLSCMVETENMAPCKIGHYYDGFSAGWCFAMIYEMVAYLCAHIIWNIPTYPSSAHGSWLVESVRRVLAWFKQKYLIAACRWLLGLGSLVSAAFAEFWST